MKNELVLCVPAIITKSIPSQSHIAGEHVLNFLDAHASWLLRDNAEVNENFKQIIPYCLCEDLNERVLVYHRKGKEGRLHGMLSLGIGGHVDFPEGRYSALLRELDEETGAKPRNIRFLGCINTDEDAVGRVHLGLAYSCVIDSSVAVPSEELHNARWVSRTQAISRKAEFEPWSQQLMEMAWTL